MPPCASTSRQGATISCSDMNLPPSRTARIRSRTSCVDTGRNGQGPWIAREPTSSSASYDPRAGGDHPRARGTAGLPARSARRPVCDRPWYAHTAPRAATGRAQPQRPRGSQRPRPARPACTGPVRQRRAGRAVPPGTGRPRPSPPDPRPLRDKDLEPEPRLTDVAELRAEHDAGGAVEAGEELLQLGTALGQRRRPQILSPASRTSNTT